MVQGLFVDRSNDQSSKAAADALREALNSTVAKTGGVSAAGASSFASGAFDPTMPLVWILVGDKPTPLKSWIAP